MKKVGLVLLAVFAVFAIVLAAGCIDTPVDNPTPTPTQGPAGSDEPSLAINIEKTGITYNIGDTMAVILPSNPSTGYSWSVKNADEGLSVTEIQPDESKAPAGVVGAPGTRGFRCEST
jgi:Predicted secreted protein